MCLPKLRPRAHSSLLFLQFLFCRFRFEMIFFLFLAAVVMSIAHHVSPSISALFAKSSDRRKKEMYWVMLRKHRSLTTIEISRIPRASCSASNLNEHSLCSIFEADRALLDKKATTTNCELFYFHFTHFADDDRSAALCCVCKSHMVAAIAFMLFAFLSFLSFSRSSRRSGISTDRSAFAYTCEASNGHNRATMDRLK